MRSRVITKPERDDSVTKRCAPKLTVVHVDRTKGAHDYSDLPHHHCVRLTIDSISTTTCPLSKEISPQNSGGQVEVVWNKNSMEAVENQKDSGTWQLLAIDTRPNYVDTHTRTPAKWKYRAIYCKDSQKIRPVELRPGDHRGGVTYLEAALSQQPNTNHRYKL